MEILNGFFNLFRSAKSRNNLYVFLICFFISFFTWLSIKLSEDYTTKIKYSVVYRNLPVDKILINQPPEEISLNVKGKGIDLFSSFFTNKRRPIIIDMNNIITEKENETFVSRVSTMRFLNQIGRQSGYYDNLVDVSPDTLVFVYDKMSFKKVPVKLNIEYSMQKQYWVDGDVRYYPDSITIHGILSLINNYTQIETSSVKLDKINSTISLKVPLKSTGSEFVIPETDSIRIVIPVKKYTESTIIIPVGNVFNDKKIKTFPQKVEITYRVSLDNYKKVKSKMFTVVADSIGNGLVEGKLIVKVKNAPDFIEVTRVFPEEVEYIFLR